MQTKLAIIGAGGLGREFAAVIKNPKYRIENQFLGYFDDGEEVGKIIEGFPILGSITSISQNWNVEIIIGIGSIQIRKKIISEIVKESKVVFFTIIHPSSIIENPKLVSIGTGVYLGAYCVLITNISVGNHSIIHNGCLIHHDVEIGENCILMPGVRITSKCKIGDNSFIGSGTIISGNFDFPADSIISSGSVIY
jgi:sugar O-acyltransferase (sialic acid O-acetyltransferase NeuD family)